MILSDCETDSIFKDKARDVNKKLFAEMASQVGKHQGQ